MGRRAASPRSTECAAVSPNSVLISPGSIRITSTPKFAHLPAHRVADRLDRELRAVVDAAAGEHEPAAHRRDVHDLAEALAAHAGQDELAHPQQAEDVRLELAPDLVHRHLLDGPGLAVAGVVDQHADRALRLLDRADGGLHRALVGHVERERLAALRLEVGDRLGPARGRVDRPPPAARDARPSCARCRWNSQ